MEELNYYCYIHLRKTDLTPFYVGIGTVQKQYKSFKTRHVRAFNISSRNTWWKKTYNKYGRIVEIVNYSNSREEICNIERELIKKYKRKEDGGTLTNLTDGGDSLFTTSPEPILQMKEKLGIPVFVYCHDGSFFKRFQSKIETCKILNLREATLRHSIEHKKMYKNYFFSLKNLGQNIDLSNYQKISKRKRSVILIYENGEKQIFKTLTEAANFLKISPGNICTILKSGRKFKNLSLEYVEKKIYEYKKTVQAFDKNGNLVHTFESASAASRFLNIKNENVGGISYSCTNGRMAHGFYWKYVNEINQDILEIGLEQSLHSDGLNPKIQNEFENLMPQ